MSEEKNCLQHKCNRKKNLRCCKMLQSYLIIPGGFTKSQQNCNHSLLLLPSLSSAEAPAGYPHQNKIIEKIESARGTMGRGKHRAPRALFFFLPSLPTTQRGLCGGESAPFEIWIWWCCKIIASYMQCIISLFTSSIINGGNFFLLLKNQVLIDKGSFFFFFIFNRNIFM